MTDTAKRPQADVRVGSSTDALSPVLAGERRMGAGLWQWLALIAVAAAALGADQLTKTVVSSHLGLDEGIHVIGPFSIHHVQNSGIAFGLFSSATAAVIVLTSVAVAWMVLFFARSGSRHPLLPAALGLVIGGSLSNLIDRVRLGHVTDFLDFKYWPAFNLADSFIVSGVIILFLVLLFTDREPRRRRLPDASATRS